MLLFLVSVPVYGPTDSIRLPFLAVLVLLAVVGVILFCRHAYLTQKLQTYTTKYKDTEHVIKRREYFGEAVDRSRKQLNYMLVFSFVCVGLMAAAAMHYY